MAACKKGFDVLPMGACRHALIFQYLAISPRRTPLHDAHTLQSLKSMAAYFCCMVLSLLLLWNTIRAISFVNQTLQQLLRCLLIPGNQMIQTHFIASGGDIFFSTEMLAEETTNFNEAIFI